MTSPPRITPVTRPCLPDDSGTVPDYLDERHDDAAELK
jgi:hypothetical protein